MNKRRQRRLRGKGSNENAVLRKMTESPKRGYLKKTGYQAGGEVGYGVSGPVMMASALTARSSDPDHAIEDAGPLATMPEGAPSTPDEGEEGYRRGGPVRKIGYQEGGDVEDDEEQDIPEPEQEEPTEIRGGFRPITPEHPDEEEEELALTGPPAEEGGEEGGGLQSPPEEGGDEEGGDEEGGGGRGAPTGYNAPPKDQADRDPAALQAQEDAAQESTGFRPQQAQQDDPEQQLRDVLDWTRKQFGLDKGQHPQQQPQQVAQVEEPAPGMRPAAQPQQPAAALPPPPSQAPAEESPAEQRPPPAPAAAQPAQPAGGMPRTEQTPTQQAGPPTAPSSAPQQLQQYLKGERSFTPEQMTQALDRATQENPHLDQSGSIRKAFQDLVGRGDMDGASRFVQALRPSYDNLRAAMVAATSEGKFVEALQIAERLNNLIPNGNQVSFHPTENGLITAIVRPESGEAARTYHLTPQQFQDYAKGAGSVFDIAADQGIDATMKSAMQGPAQNPENAPPYQVAGPMMPPPEGQTRVQAPPETPLPQPRPAEAGPPATPESPLAQAQRTAAGLPGQAPTATPAPSTAAPPGGGDRVRQLEQQPQPQPQPQPQRQATGYQPTTAGRVAPMAPGQQPREGETRNFPPRSEAPAGGKYPPSGGTLPTAPPYSARYNWDTGKWEPVGQSRFNARSGQWEPSTGYQNSPARQGAPTTTTRVDANGNIVSSTVSPGATPRQTQQQPPDQQRQGAQPQTTGQGQQRQSGQYTGTPEQKRQQYQQDLKDWELKERARQAYPHTADQDKRAKYEDTLRAREGTQQRHTERQSLDREKLNAQNQRAQQTLDGLNDRAVQNNLRSLVTERERGAMQELRDRVNNFTRANKDDPTATYPYSDRDKQLIDRMHNTAVENDLYEQLRPKLRQDPNANPRPVAPAAPAGQTTPAAPKVDLEKYRGDSEPHPAPAGQQWGRSKSTGQWSLRPMERRPTVPMSQ